MVRKCGECTLCCNLPYIEELHKKSGVLCEHYDDGCKIYASRPQACREFKCLYRQVAKVNIALRPDKCGVMFEKLSDDLIVGTMSPNRRTYPYLRSQINSFIAECINVVLIKNGVPTIYHLDNVAPAEILSRLHKVIEGCTDGCSSV